MFEELEKAAAKLADPKAGWVNRRDAVEYLGASATRAIDALKRFVNESDVDVRHAIEVELARVKAALDSVKEAARSYTLDELLQRVAKKDERIVTRTDDGYVVEVRLKNGRSQRVYVAPYQLSERAELIRVITYCGVAREDLFEWALHANTKLAHGAIAVTDENGEKRFCILNCFLASETTPLEIRNSVKEIAYFGDWMESKISGEDRL